MTGFTQGPWTLNVQDGKFLIPMVGIDLGDGGGLLPIVETVHGYDTEQCEANAQLIAAAPELLDALKLLVDNGGIGPESMFRYARAAIAKATGAA